MLARWPFPEAADLPVVTTVHITKRGVPILYVSHENDEEGGSIWQFHNETIPFAMEDAQLVRLGTIAKLDPSVLEVADLPLGYYATRTAPGAVWQRKKMST
jgi:hypothetical protein